MEMTEQGLACNRAFEGRALKAYRCPAGIWTIGYGTTNADTWAVAYLGRKIGPGLTITEAQADYMMRESMKRRYGPAVASAMVNPKPNEFDAGCLFHWNTGAIKKANWVKAWRTHSTAKQIRAGFMAWSKGGGRVLTGLVRRRRREADILLLGEYGPEGKVKIHQPTGGVIVRPAAAADAPFTPGMLRKGDSGSEVDELNAALILLGFDVSTGDQFDEKTDKAVRAFQKAHAQLRADGIVGPATRAALAREVDAKKQLTIGTAATGGPTAAIVAGDQATGGNLPLTVYAVLGAIVLGTIIWIAWKYRDEIAAMAKRGK